MNAPVMDPGCTGKTRYLNKGEAMRCIQRRKGDKRIKSFGGRHGVNAYRCPNCKFWHVGSSSL